MKTQKKTIKDFTINFKDPIHHHSLTLNSAKKWLEQNVKHNKLSISSKDSLVISIDSTISKNRLSSLVKKFLEFKKAKYYTVRYTSPSSLSVVSVK